MFSWWSCAAAKDTNSAIPKLINKQGGESRAAQPCTAATAQWSGGGGPKSGDPRTNLWTRSGTAGRAEAPPTDCWHHFLMDLLFFCLRGAHLCTDLSKSHTSFVKNTVTLMLDYISHKPSLPNHWKQDELSDLTPSYKEDFNVWCSELIYLLKFTTNPFSSLTFWNLLLVKSVQNLVQILREPWYLLKCTG